MNCAATAVQKPESRGSSLDPTACGGQFLLMLFADYYAGLFREDIARVASALPSRHEHTPGETTLQPRSISRRNAVIRGWSPERRALFAASLFLTVLADQVCYTHFRPSYDRFRRLTMYPKWRGDCPGGCHAHIHPRVVFQAIGAREGRRGEMQELPFAAFPDDLFATMRLEVLDFVGTYLTGVDPEDFWRRCDAEMPLDFKTRYRASRRPTV